MSLRRTSKRTRISLLLGVAAVSSIALWSPAGQAAGKTETLRYFIKDTTTTITHADGTAVRRPPYPQPAPGDVLEVNALDYRGNHLRHAARSTASQYIRCVFAAGPPDCRVIVAIGGSLLIFDGTPGTLVNGTGRYQGASGRVLSVKELTGGADVVARVTRG